MKRKDHEIFNVIRSNDMESFKELCGDVAVVFSSRGRGQFIQLMRSHGADPHMENDDQVSPLSLANDIADFDVAQWFKDLD